VGMECTLNDSNGVTHTVIFDSNVGSGKPALNCDIFGDHVTSLITKITACCYVTLYSSM
jgi:hypothetical protein